MSLHNLELCLSCGKIADQPTPSLDSRLPCVLCQKCFRDQVPKICGAGADNAERYRHDLKIAPSEIHENPKTVTKTQLAKDDASRQARASLRDSIDLSGDDAESILKSSEAPSSDDEQKIIVSSGSSATSLDVMEGDEVEEEKKARLGDEVVLNNFAEVLERMTKILSAPIHPPQEFVDYEPRIRARIKAMMESRTPIKSLSSTKELSSLTSPVKPKVNNIRDNQDNKHIEKPKHTSTPRPSKPSLTRPRSKPSLVGKSPKPAKAKGITRVPIALPAVVANQGNRASGKKVQNVVTQPPLRTKPAANIQQTTTTLYAPPVPPKDTVSALPPPARPKDTLPASSPPRRSASEGSETRRSPSPDVWNRPEIRYDDSIRGRSPTPRPGTNSKEEPATKPKTSIFRRPILRRKPSGQIAGSLNVTSKSRILKPTSYRGFPATPVRETQASLPSNPSTKPQTSISRLKPSAEMSGALNVASRTAILKPPSHGSFPAAPIRETRTSLLRKRDSHNNLQSNNTNSTPQVNHSSIPRLSRPIKPKLKYPTTALTANAYRMGES
jgi:hypothetical protein